MACNNCENGCVHPQLCACDCASCAEANSCDIPVGDTGPGGPAGPMGPPGTNGVNGTNGTNGTDGCSTQSVYVSDGTDGNIIGDIIVTTAVGAPCPQTINAGNLLSIINSGTSSVIPSGIIVMWSGPVVLVPTGWLICDGTSGTPDLRGRFIGAWGNRAIDAPFNGINGSGGTMTVNLTQPNIPAHVHGVGGYTVTSTIPSTGIHRHSIVANSGGNGGAQGNSCYRTTGNDQPPANNSIFQTGNSIPWPASGSDEGAHTHPVVSGLGGSSGDGTPALSAPQGSGFSIVPKYWTLAFIMKQ
tara:strand:- start:6775 stop:7674 length:900 start_codon:yes stop_codon:yes gene_type:complete